jgi:2-dehydro-3-deoxygalactonokinase
MVTLARTMNFVSCDWGTSNFRLRLIGGPGGAEVRTDDGAAKLAAAGGDRAAAFREVLTRGLAQLGAAEELPVVISGMASSTIGWRQLPYARLPFALDGSATVWERLEGRLLLISGLRGEADMARGEETQAIGLAAALGSGLPARVTVVLPGTHSKHLMVEAGMIITLRTFMTGELFDLLSRQSVLRHSVDVAAAVDASAFVEGVRELDRAPLTGGLFRVRTRQVLDQQPAHANASFLSGLLIGAELAALRNRELPVLVAAGGTVREAYILAGDALGFGNQLRAVDAEPLSAVGQAVILRQVAAKESGRS